MMSFLTILLLVVAASAYPSRYTNFIETLNRKVDLQQWSFQSCDAAGFIADLLGDAKLAACLNSSPEGTPYPACGAASNSDYATWCSTCVDTYSTMANKAKAHGCSISDLSTPECTTDAQCGMGTYCSVNGNCGGNCTTTADCMSCNEKCMAMGSVMVCTGPPNAAFSANAYQYLGPLQCAQNSNSDYCGVVLSEPDVPTCQQFTDAGCCAGLTAQFVTNCGAPQSLVDQVNAVMTNCTGADWTGTCGLPAPGPCCQSGTNCPAGAAASLIPHFGMIAALVLFKLFH